MNGIKMLYKFPRRTFQYARTVLDLLNRNRLFANGRIDHLPLPRTVSFKLTNRCDLRCYMCMQWGRKGTHIAYSNGEQKEEMNWELLKKRLR